MGGTVSMSSNINGPKGMGQLAHSSHRSTQ